MTSAVEKFCKTAHTPNSKGNCLYRIASVVLTPKTSAPPCNST